MSGVGEGPATGMENPPIVPGGRRRRRRRPPGSRFAISLMLVALPVGSLLAFRPAVGSRFVDAPTSDTVSATPSGGAPAPIGVGRRATGPTTGPVQARQAKGQPSEGDAEDRLMQGLRLLESGDAEAAVEELRAAVSLRPDDHRARYHLGRALFTAGDPEAAVPHLEEALRQGAEAGPVHFLLGQVRLDLGEYSEARASFDAAAEARPSFPPLTFYRAELCYRIGRVDAALELLAEVAETSPQWAGPRARAGTIALESGRVDEALEWFRIAVEMTPDDPTLWMRLASALVEAEEAEEAVDAYRRAVELAPDRVAPRIALILQLVSLQRTDAAMAQIDALLEREPERGVALARYHRAKILSSKGDHEGALEELRAALLALRRRTDDELVDPARTEPRQLLAQARELGVELLVELGRGEEAERAARALVEAHPRYPEGHYRLGNLLVRNGDAEGREHLTRFKALSDAREHRDLGDYYRLQVDEPSRAGAEYEKALEAVPDDPGSLVGLAAVTRAAGEPAAALEHLRRAREAGADGAEWYRVRVLALSDLGRSSAAREAFEAARAAGHQLGSEVWRAVHAEVGGCRPAGGGAS